VISYIRRNLVAFVALFVAIIMTGGGVAYAANTIRSSDIVDGQVKNQDLADNSVGTHKIQDGSVLGADIKDDSLSGADIKESTLGPVPDANTLQGWPLGAILDVTRHTQETFADPTYQCSKPGVWSECGKTTLDVPAGHTYTVTIWSSVTADSPTISVQAQFCPSITGPTCVDARGETVTFAAGDLVNAATSATVKLGAGHYDLSTAVLFSFGLAPVADENTVTTIEYYDSGF